MDNGLYLIRLAQIHESFRRPELEAIAQVLDIDLEIVDYSDESPFCIVRLVSDAAARALIGRSVLATAIYSLWSQATNYDQLHIQLTEDPRAKAQIERYEFHSFKFNVDCFRGSRSDTDRRTLIDSFSYLNFQGPICMKDPELDFTVFEEYPAKLSQPTQDSTTPPASAAARVPQRIFLGTFVATSNRDAVNTFDLKKRSYISTTSMDACLALVTANLALASDGKTAYDPFVGTGGFPLACAHFGSCVWGSDIDGRSLRGKSRFPGGKGSMIERSVLGNFKQYGLTSRYLDGFIGDLTHSPLRLPGLGLGGSHPEDHKTGSMPRLNVNGATRWLDAIVCDPPYGVREGLKTLGCSRAGAGLEAVRLANGELAHLKPDYVFPKKPYSFDALQMDILTFAARSLVDGGRLCMWMPSANQVELETEHADANVQDKEPNEEQLDDQNRVARGEKQTRTAIPIHPLLKVVCVCVQDFNRWSRRLLTYERIAGDSSDNATQQDSNEGEMAVAVPFAGLDNGDSALRLRGTADELNSFRKQYFQGFKYPA